MARSAHNSQVEGYLSKTYDKMCTYQSGGWDTCLKLMVRSAHNSVEEGYHLRLAHLRLVVAEVEPVLGETAKG